MNLVYWAIIGIGVFVAIWMLIVVPAERRHHERKLAVIQKKLEQRQAQEGEEDGGLPENSANAKEES